MHAASADDIAALLDSYQRSKTTLPTSSQRNNVQIRVQCLFSCTLAPYYVDRLSYVFFESTEQNTSSQPYQGILLLQAESQCLNSALAAYFNPGQLM